MPPIYGPRSGRLLPPLDEARENLAGALRDMAETNLLRGEPLPVPDPIRFDSRAELDEPIYLVLHMESQEIGIVLVQSAVFATITCALPNERSESRGHQPPSELTRSCRALDFRIATNVL